MDTLTNYRNVIQEIIKKYYNLANAQSAKTTNSTISDRTYSNITERLILDAERDQYLWLRCGWDGKKRIQYIILYLQIQNGKVWVEEDNTDLGIVDELLAAGIPETDIILGFQHPSKRALRESVIS